MPIRFTPDERFPTRSALFAEIHRLGELAHQAARERRPAADYTRQIDELAARYRMAEGIGLDDDRRREAASASAPPAEVPHRQHADVAGGHLPALPDRPA